MPWVKHEPTKKWEAVFETQGIMSVSMSSREHAGGCAELPAFKGQLIASNHGGSQYQYPRKKNWGEGFDKSSTKGVIRRWGGGGGEKGGGGFWGQKSQQKVVKKLFVI